MVLDDRKKILLALSPENSVDLTQVIISGLSEFNSFGQAKISKVSDSGPIGTIVSTVMNISPIVTTNQVEKKIKYILSDELTEQAEEILKQTTYKSDLNSLNVLLSSIASSNKGYFNYKSPKEMSRFLYFLKEVFEKNAYAIKENIDLIVPALELALLRIYEDFPNLIQNGHSFGAFMSVLNHTCKLQDKKPQLILKDNQCINKLNDHGNIWMSPSNFSFIDELMPIFDSLIKQSSEGVPLNDQVVSLLRGQFNNAIEFLEFFAGLLQDKSFVEKIASGNASNYENLLKLATENIIKYWNLDYDQDLKGLTLKKLINTCTSILNNEELPFEIKKSVWQTLEMLFAKDSKNLISGQEQLCSSILRILKKDLLLTNQSAQSASLFKVLTTLSNKVGGNSPLALSLLSVVAEDMKSYEDTIPITNLSSHFEVLSNISALNVVQKSIAKNTLLMRQLAHHYKGINTLSSKDKANLSNIIKNVLSNSVNNQNLIEQVPEVYDSLAHNLSQPIDFEDTQCELANQNDETTLTNILSNDNTYSQLISAGLFPKDVLAEIFEIHKDSTVMSQLQAKINSILESVTKEEYMRKLAAEIEDKTQMVNSLFSKNLTQLIDLCKTGQLDPSKFRPSLAVSFSNDRVSLSTIPIFPSFSQENNSNLLPIEISSKNNDNLAVLIEQILDMANNLLNVMSKEIKVDLSIFTSQAFIKEIELFHKLLKSLRQLAHHPDNHQPILQLGLIDLLGKLQSEENTTLREEFQVECNDAVKFCSSSPNGALTLINGPLINEIGKRFLEKLEKPESVISEKAKAALVKGTFILSNICKYPEGFKKVFDVINLENLLKIASKSSSAEILGCVQSILLNYIQSSRTDYLPHLADIIAFNAAISKLSNKTGSMLNNCFLISGNVVGIMDRVRGRSESSSQENTRKISDEGKEMRVHLRKSLAFDPKIILSQNSLINQAADDYEKLILKNSAIFNSLLYFLSSISKESVSSCIELMKSGLLSKIISTFSKNELSKVQVGFDDIGDSSVLNSNIKLESDDLFGNDQICENYTRLIANLLGFDSDNIKLLTNTGVIEHLFKILDKHLEDENSESILNNCLICLDKLTEDRNALDYCKDSFNLIATLLQILREKGDKKDIVKHCLSCMCNYLQYDNGTSLKEIDFETLIQILIDLQKIYYANSEILITINILADILLTKFAKEKQAKEKLFKLIVLSINIQEWNTDIVSNALKLICHHLGLVFLVEELAESHLSTLINVLSNHKTNQFAILSCCEILGAVGDNSVYATSMIMYGLLNQASIVLSNLDVEAILQADRESIEKSIFELLAKLVKDKYSLEQIGLQLMKHLIDYYSNASNSSNDPVRAILLALSKNPKAIEPFIHHKGIQATCTVLKDDLASVRGVIDTFKIVENIVELNDEYKEEFLNLNMIELINQVMAEKGHLDKKVDFEARSKLIN